MRQAGYGVASKTPLDNLRAVADDLGELIHMAQVNLGQQEF
jgi:hypothetical protein